MLAAESKVIEEAAAPNLTFVRSRSWKEIVGPVEPFLAEVARSLGEQVEVFDPEIVPFARYALTNQGKQLRPALVALSGACIGKPNEGLVKVATIIEMIHLATLVHDDIMDSASIRRRRPTLAANWGNEVSVLLGDCLFAHALSLAASFPTPEVCRAVAGATNTVCSGEILQTLRRGRIEPDRAEYFKVIGMKTGELFALSCDMGSWLSGAKPEDRKALRAFGHELGTAYQVYDDCVDLFGVESRAGKSLGSDLAEGKLTLPVILALERCGAGERLELEGLLRDWKPGNIERLQEILTQSGSVDETLNIFRGIVVKARSHLVLLPETGGRQALAGLTEFLEQQTEALPVRNDN